MAGRDDLSPARERLRALVARCEQLRLHSRKIGDDTAHLIARSERLITECSERLKKHKQA
jgi:hypothetical protein